MKTLSPETWRFIQEHCEDDVRNLALQGKKYPLVDMAEAVIQIAARQIAEKKLPSWGSVEGIYYPGHLSMEQCSSEQTALYKASLVRGDSFADLTAGFGVDCAYISRNFAQADYVERQEGLCELATHNFPLLGLNHIRVNHADGIDFLAKMEPVDCLFLDPARRDKNGGKTVAITDCEPDVCALEPLLVEKGKTVLIKLSPMLDIASALRDLKYIREIHVISLQNECKELLLILRKEAASVKKETSEVQIHCVQLFSHAPSQHFSFSYEQEKRAICPISEQVETYLYEPGAALLKASPFRLLASAYGVKKLHSNSHLYTSSQFVDFPGRCFKVVGISGFGKKELKTFLEGVEKANLTVRNFPSSVADLRKKLKIKEGGEIYLFATTLGDGQKVLVKCRKVGQEEA